MAYINHDNPKPGARYDVVGELRFSQKEPLAHRGTDARYNVCLLILFAIVCQYNMCTFFHITS